MNIREDIKYGYDLDTIHLTGDMGNKLFCTFTNQEGLEELVDTIKERYTIMYGKIFVLYSKEQDEYLCTYNVDLGNVNTFLDNTILVHRKKETNTLYTINALNQLIKTLNGGVLDTSFRINWTDYKNSILLTKGYEFKKVATELFNIIKLEN